MFLDFNSVNDVYHDNNYAQALYLGSELIWEKKNNSPEKDLADNFIKNGLSSKIINIGLGDVTDMYYDEENRRFIVCGDSKSKSGIVILTDEEIISKNKISSNQITTCCYGNDKIIGCCNKKIYIFNKSGELLSEKSYNFGGTINKIRFYNGTFIIIMNNGYISTSTDGVVWKSKTTNTKNNLYDISYGDGRMVVVGLKNTVLYSDDNGNTWNSKSFNYYSSKDKFTSIDYSKVDNKFLIVCNDYKKSSGRYIYIVNKDTLEKESSSQFTDSNNYNSTYHIATNGYITLAPAYFDIYNYRLNYSTDLGKTYGYFGSGSYKMHIEMSCFGKNRILFGRSDGNIKYSKINNKEV